MKKQKQPVDRDLVDRSFFARVEPFLYLLPFLIGIAVFTLRSLTVREKLH